MNESTNLREHIIATYITLRIGLAVAVILLPFVLWIGGRLIFEVPLQESMSAYYHAGEGAMRDVFVGALIAVGAFLYLYKGFTNLENIALKLAGILLVGVALFPMEWNCGSSCSKFSLHGIFAISFFLCIAYVCIFRASDTLHLIQDQAKAKQYQRTYKWLGLLMIVTPAIALALTWIKRILVPGLELNYWVFLVEAIGVIVFGSYWIIKSREIAITNSERRAIEGKLSARPFHVEDVFKQMPVDQVEGGRR